MMKAKIYFGAAFAAAILAFGACKKKDNTTTASTVTISTKLPTVTTSAIDSVRDGMAWVSANISSEGTSAITAVGVCWDVKTAATTLRPHTNDGAGTGSYQSNLVNLQPNTTYFVRAYATNASGTAYANEITFKTPAGWSVVSQSIGGQAINALLANNSLVYAGTSSGVFKSSNNQGSQWTSSGLNNIFITCLVQNATTLFAGTSGSGIYTSTDGGANWSTANVGLLGNNVVSMCVAGSNIMAATDYGLYISSDNGGTWYSSNNGVGSNNINTVAGNSTRMFAGAYSNGVYASSDNGSSWNAASNGLGTPQVSVQSLITSGSNVVACTSQGLYISANNGGSWSKINGINANLLTLASKGSDVYAAGFGRAYLSHNNGGSFGEISLGLPAGGIINSISANDAFIFCTDGNSILRYPVQ